MTNVITPRTKGWLPGLDRRQVGERFVMDGANFINSVEGPHTAFGYRLMSYETLAASTNQKTFEVESESLIFCTGAIFAFDAVSQLIYPVFTFADSGLNSPWTGTFVGNKYYFAKRGVGLIQYDPVTYNWQVLSGGSIPNGIWFCDSTNGRLFVVTATDYYWSAFDDGTDLATSSVTGAGAQSLGIIRNGEPLGLGHINNGMLIYTTEGVVIAQYVDAVNPFYHRELDVDDRPLNAYCIVRKDRDQIILTRTGFYMINRNGEFELWQQLMSEYFKDHIANRYIDPQNVGIFNLFYDPFNKWFYFSISETGEAFAYNLAYVLNINLDEWGIMTHAHKSIIEFSLNSTIFEGNNIGLVDANGYVLLLNTANYIEAAPDFVTDELVAVNFDDDNLLSYKDTGVWIMNSIINMPESSDIDLGLLTADSLYQYILGVYSGYNKYVEASDVLDGVGISEDSVTTNLGDSADTITEDSSTGLHGFYQDFNLVNIGSHIGVKVKCKAGTRNRLMLRISDADNLSDYIARIFSWTGTAVAQGLALTSGTDDFQEHINIAPIQFVNPLDGSDWFYIALGGRPNTKAKTLRIEFLLVDATVSETYTGDGVSNYYMDRDRIVVYETVQLIQYTMTQQSLNSFIDVGLFRLTDNEDANQLNTVYNVTVHHDENSILDTEEDWLSLTSEEDWLALNSEEDWGVDIVNGSSYSIEGFGTLDGTNVFAEQQEVLTLNASMDDPNVNSYKTNFYTCELLGLYQYFRISAFNLNETFHLRLLEADAKLTGRL